MTGSATPAEPVGRPVHISMAVDRGFEIPLGVSLLSLAEAQSSSGVACSVSVLCTGLDAADRNRIERDVAGRLAVEWIEVDPRLVDGAHYTVGLSSAALFRILLPDLLPPTRDRTLYLDADTLVVEPLTPLWDTPLPGDLLLAAVRDAGTTHAAGPLGTDWRGLDLPPDTPYFNSGLILFALDRWREEGTAQETLRILRQRQLRWGDQDALNLVARGRWLELPRRWNLQTADAEGRSLSWVLWREDVEAAMERPAIIHYTEPEKPWRGRLDHPFAAEWLAALGRSGWPDLDMSPPSAAARAWGRLRRAGRVLRYG